MDHLYGPLLDSEWTLIFAVIRFIEWTHNVCSDLSVVQYHVVVLDSVHLSLWPISSPIPTCKVIRSREVAVPYKYTVTTYLACAPEPGNSPDESSPA